MAASLNFVQIDALIDDSTRVPLTFSPAFSPEVTSYELHAPKAATRISIGATSFGAAQVKVQGIPGSLSTVAVTGSGVEVVASLHNKADGAEIRRYVFSVKQGDVDVSGAEKIEKMKAPEKAPEAAHAHSHGGVPCTLDHGHSHAAAAPEKPKHSHSHGDGKECTADHGHAAAAPEKPKHTHSHGDGKECTENHGDSHSSHSHGENKEHGHSHDDKKPKHSHGHSDAAAAPEEPKHSHGDGKECTADPSSHSHAHGNALDVEMAEADGGKYQWNQDSDTVTVEVPVPEGTQGKDVTVAIEAASLRVEVSTLDAAKRVVLDGALFAKVSKDSCSWSIVVRCCGLRLLPAQEKEKRVLVVTLAKMEHQKAWDGVLAPTAAPAHGHAHA